MDTNHGPHLLQAHALTSMTFQGFLWLETCFPHTPQKLTLVSRGCLGMLLECTAADWMAWERKGWDECHCIRDSDTLRRATAHSPVSDEHLWTMNSSAKCESGGVIKLPENSNCQMTGTQTVSCHYCLHSNTMILLDLRRVHLWKWRRETQAFRAQ